MLIGEERVHFYTTHIAMTTVVTKQNAVTSQSETYKSSELIIQTIITPELIIQTVRPNCGLGQPLLRV